MKKVFYLLLTMFLLNACQTKDSYLGDFRGFVEDVQTEMADYSDADWEKADQRFEKLSTSLYTKFEEELSAKEKGEIVKLQATYAALKVKAGVKNAAKKVDQFLDGLKSGK